MFKRGPLPTVSRFRQDYPQFDQATDQQIQFRLDLAGDLIRVQATGKRIYPKLAELFVAHYLSVYGYGELDSDGDLAVPGSVSATGGNTGNVASKAVDKVSISYDYGYLNSTLNPNAGWWNNSVYGQEFYQLISMFGAGGIQL